MWADKGPYGGPIRPAAVHHKYTCDWALLHLTCASDAIDDCRRLYLLCVHACRGAVRSALCG